MPWNVTHSLGGFPQEDVSARLTSYPHAEYSSTTQTSVAHGWRYAIEHFDCNYQACNFFLQIAGLCGVWKQILHVPQCKQPTTTATQDHEKVAPSVLEELHLYLDYCLCYSRRLCLWGPFAWDKWSQHTDKHTIGVSHLCSGPYQKSGIWSSTASLYSFCRQDGHPKTHPLSSGTIKSLLALLAEVTVLINQSYEVILVNVK